MNTTSNSKALSSQTVDRKLAREATERLKSALKNFPCVSAIKSFRQAFHDTYHVQGQQSGYTDLLTAMLCVERLDEVTPLALVVDEGLSWNLVRDRRKVQADRLDVFIKRHAAETGFLAPDILYRKLPKLPLPCPGAIVRSLCLAGQIHPVDPQ